MEEQAIEEIQIPQASGDELLLMRIDSVEYAVKLLLSTVSQYGSPEQAVFVSQMWTGILDMKDAQEDYMGAKSMVVKEGIN